MKRWCGACLLLVVAALPARAHFVWIVPDQAGALVVFSDNLLPDANVPVTKIAGTELFIIGEGGKATALKAAQEKNAYRVAAPAKGQPAVIGGVCRYGVVQKGKAEPFLLVYCAKGLVGGTLKDAPEGFVQPTPRLPLEIVLIEGKGKARLLWQGKPLAGAEVAVLPPGEAEPTEGKTDKNGTFMLATPKVAGVYAIRARHVEPKEGDHDGKKYKEVRYYSTLTFAMRGDVGEDGPSGGAPPKADPEATRLLRDARAARVNWEKIPGFIAVLGLPSVAGAGDAQLRPLDPHGVRAAAGAGRDLAIRQFAQQPQFRPGPAAPVGGVEVLAEVHRGPARLLSWGRGGVPKAQPSATPPWSRASQRPDADCGWSAVNQRLITSPAWTMTRRVWVTSFPFSRHRALTS
jgi:hypothetical protein